MIGQWKGGLPVCRVFDVSLAVIGQWKGVHQCVGCLVRAWQ